MATLALATTHVDKSMRKRKITVKGTASGNYTQGTPIVIDLTTVTNPSFLSAGKIGSNPKHGVVLKVPGGYDATLIQGATMKTWGLTIYASGGSELATGALPAALTNDFFEFEFEGPKGSF